MDRWVATLFQKHKLKFKVNDAIYVTIRCIIKKRLSCDQGLARYVCSAICKHLYRQLKVEIVYGMLARYLQETPERKIYWHRIKNDIPLFHTKWKKRVVK